MDLAKGGELITCIQSSAQDPPVNGLTFWPNSGLLFTPCDGPKIGMYFIPSLGVAPRWCAFLDALTEELEENKEAGTRLLGP